MTLWHGYAGTPLEIRTITIETAPHDDQRYDTVGDYQFTGIDGKELAMKVSDMGDWRFGIACAVHELVEAALLVVDGVDEAQVSAFDEDYERARQGYLSLDRIALAHAIPPPDNRHQLAIGAYRKKWKCDCEIDESSEPGEDRHAPYRLQHAVADGIERTFAAALGIVWKDYEEKVVSMAWRAGRATEEADGKKEVSD